MKLKETGIAGCHELLCNVFRDNRGTFTKTFHYDEFRSLGLRTDWKEEYYSLSEKNVIRGMHFQTPPDAHVKLVSCLAGEIVDVVLDLRRNSRTFGQYRTFTVSSVTGNSIYVPVGCAHGFLSLTDNTIVNYMATSVYSPDNDCGVLWSSFGFDWPVENPVMSDRDKSHPPFYKYESPFYNGD